MRHPYLWIMLLGALLPLQESFARIYKWVDEEGNVHYTQQRPPDRPAQILKEPTSPVTEEQAKENLEKLSDRAETQRKDREFQEGYADDVAARQERIKKNCEIARENLRILQTAARVQDKNGEGNMYYIDDATKEAKIAKTKEQIETFCP